jgi:hypothetical protein
VTRVTKTGGSRGIGGISLKIQVVSKAVVIIAGLALAGSAKASPLTVLNASFENLSPGGLPFGCGPGCAYSIDVIPDWVTTDTSATGQFQPNATYFNLPLPDGNVLAYSNIAGATISQALGDTLVAGTLYTLQIDIGNRLDGLYVQPLVQLFAGNTLIATGSAVNPTSGNFDTSVALYASPIGDALAGQNLRIVLTSNGPQADFDNVRLDALTIAATPEPASFAMLGLGLIGLGGLARRKR